MLWRMFSTSCSFYSLTFPAMRIAGVAHSPSWLVCCDCSMCLALSSAGGGKQPKGAFRDSSGSLEDSPDPCKSPQETSGISAYGGILSGFAQHVSAIHLPPANLQGCCKETCFDGDKHCRVMTGKAWCMDMDICWHRDGSSANIWNWAHNSALHNHKPFTFLKASSEFGLFNFNLAMRPISQE